MINTKKKKLMSAMHFTNILLFNVTNLVKRISRFQSVAWLVPSTQWTSEPKPLNFKPTPAQCHLCVPAAFWGNCFCVNYFREGDAISFNLRKDHVLSKAWKY